MIDQPLHSPDENTNFHFDNVTFNKDAHVTIAGKAKAIGCTFFGDLIVAGSLYLKKTTCYGSVVAGSYFSAYNSSLQGGVSVGASLYAYKCAFGTAKIFAQDFVSFMKCSTASNVEGKSLTANNTVVESFVKTTADFLVGKAFMRNFGARKT